MLYSDLTMSTRPRSFKISMHPCLKGRSHYSTRWSTQLSRVNSSCDVTPKDAYSLRLLPKLLSAQSAALKWRTTAASSQLTVLNSECIAKVILRCSIRLSLSQPDYEALRSAHGHSENSSPADSKQLTLLRSAQATETARSRAGFSRVNSACDITPKAASSLRLLPKQLSADSTALEWFALQQLQHSSHASTAKRSTRLTYHLPPDMIQVTTIRQDSKLNLSNYASIALQSENSSPADAKQLTLLRSAQDIETARTRAGVNRNQSSFLHHKLSMT
ncbi:hypothetical protein F511_01155 [Dorcoceras hygrometricum]|nr:hypothetical protein F511_01155 [Dorcoceras hygrometricum]